VVRTRVGYAGGTKEEPTYRSLGDHTETIQIDYDPEKISYETLLDVFWDSHNPTVPVWSRQYMSAIFYHDENQKRLALVSMESREAKLDSKIYTEVTPFSEFYLAEDYHQKYYLQGVSELKRDTRAVYPDTENFINSTAAARLNGFVSGYGSVETLKDNLNDFGLSPDGKEKLTEIVAGWGDRGDRMEKGDACAFN
jgi:peptide-methionine (S)-S-oxide reductase